MTIDDVNLNDPFAVFNRLGKLAAESKYRVDKIDQLESEQAEADHEIGRLKLIAREYLIQQDEVTVPCGRHSAKDFRFAEWYVTTDDNGDVICREEGAWSTMTPLSDDQIANALICCESDCACYQSDRDRAVNGNGYHLPGPAPRLVIEDLEPIDDPA